MYLTLARLILTITIIISFPFLSRHEQCTDVFLVFLRLLSGICVIYSAISQGDKQTFTLPKFLIQLIKYISYIIAVIGYIILASMIFLFILLPVFCLGSNSEPPIEPQGPSGAIFKYDLLETYPGGSIGAFKTVDWDPGHVNNEIQYYKPENAVQDPFTGEIVITAERRQDGNVYSAR